MFKKPKDNILSLYKNDFDGKLNFTYNFDDLYEFYNEYYQLIKFWNKVSRANFWCKIWTNYRTARKQIKELLNFWTWFWKRMFKILWNKKTY